MRNIYISIAVMAAILFGGGLAVQHLGATAVRIVTVVGIAAGFILLHALMAAIGAGSEPEEGQWLLGRRRRRR